MSTSTLNVHDVVSIKKMIKLHSGFMSYVIVAKTESGHETEIVLFSPWDDKKITISDLEIIDYREKKE